MNKKSTNGKRNFKILVLTIGILLGSFVLASAQGKSDEKIKVSADESKALKKIEESKTLDEKVNLITEFIKKYPQSPARGQVAGYLAGQIAQTKDDNQIIKYGETYLTLFAEPAEVDLILPSLVYSYVALKRQKDAFAVAEKYLSRHPEDVAIRLQMAIEGSNLLRAGNKEFAPASRTFAVQAIELIEAGKKPAEIEEARWQEFQTKWLPQLYQTLGIFDFFAGDKDKARGSLEKAVKLDPEDINSWVLLATMVDEEYQALALKHNATNPGTEREAVLKQANEKMDQVIEMFARIVALTDGKPDVKPLNEQVRQNLEQYYKYRHKNLDGLNDLIKKYKTS